VIKDIDSIKQQTATTGQGIMRMLIFCDEILKEKKGSLSCQSSELGFFVIFKDLCITTYVVGHWR
jgi:hypothetical protein